MRISKRKYILSILFLPILLAHPIDFEILEKKVIRIKGKNFTKSNILSTQYGNKNSVRNRSRNQNEKEELIFNNNDYNYSSRHLEKNNNDPVVDDTRYEHSFNKFHFIHRFYKRPNETKHRIKKQQYLPKKAPVYIPDQYIVLFKKDAEDLTIQQHIEQLYSNIQIKNKAKGHQKNEIQHVYNIDGFRGYHGKFDEATIKMIKESSEVLSIERDQRIRINELNVQSNAPWNLSRISRRQFLENNMNKNKYVYRHSSGQHVTVYIIDTGVNIDHVEFEGRARWGATFSEEIEKTDLNGHGTHVAGIIGGRIYGVAKKVNIVAIKVVNKDGEGSLSSVIQGLEFAINDHLKRKKENENVSSFPTNSIVNFSIGGPLSTILNRAVDTAVRNGINIITAAGNEYGDACEASPASSINAITVAAINKNDEMTDYSNHGNCVNVFAPGEDIESAWIGDSNNLINSLSGTSMASPHVAGVVALLLDSEDYANYTPEQIRNLIEKKSTKNMVKKIPIWSTTPNRIIYSMPPVKGTEFADNDKANDNDPDDLDDIVDDDDDKPDDLDDIEDGDGDDGNDNDDKNGDKPDDNLGDIIDDDDDDKNGDKPDDNLGDIIDDDDDDKNGDKPDDNLGDIIDDDDDDKNGDKPDDNLGDIIDDDDDDDDKDKDNDDIGDIIDDDDNDKDKDNDDIGDIIDDDDDDKDKDNDDIGDIIDDDDDDDKDKDNDDIGDIIDDDDDKDKDNDDIGDIIDDDDDDKDKDNDDIGDIIDDDDDDKDKDNDDIGDIIDDDDNDKSSSDDDLDDIEIEDHFEDLSQFKDKKYFKKMNYPTKPSNPSNRKNKTYITDYIYKQIKK